jgi:competence protein ComEA
VRQELREWLEELACRAGFEGLPPSARNAAFVGGVIVVCLAVWWWGRPPEAARPQSAGDAGAVETSVSASESRPSAPSTVTVHVVGAVGRPGVYCLPTGARVADAVQAAGGLLGNAEPTGVNLARPVSDGEQIVVPVQGQVPAAGAGGVAPGSAAGASGGAVSGGPIDLNTATVEQLDTLPGVGPATAAKIIADRTENGPFRTAEDLMRVTGIGAKRYESLKDLVTVR